MVLALPFAWWYLSGCSGSGPLLHDLISGGLDLLGLSDDVSSKIQVVEFGLFWGSFQSSSEGVPFVGFEVCRSSFDGMLDFSLLLEIFGQKPTFSDGFSKAFCGGSDIGQAGALELGRYLWMDGG